MKKSEKELDFDKAMDKLEQIVEKLEDGDIPLEEAMSLYSDGAALAALCSKKLDDARQTIEKINIANEKITDKSDEN